MEEDVKRGEEHFTLRRSTGEVELEISIIGGRTHLRVPTRDALLECEGNFEVRAGEAIRMTGAQFEVKASGDARLEAGGAMKLEAASQECVGREGEIRLNAKRNLVLWGEFVLLNTKDEKPWTSRT
ncbi:MAG: hypothetical protein ACLP9L_05780 [Thermoguttaceae bacterium]